MKVTDKLTITNEDNMELMSRYPDNYFDLAIVDPPYGIGVSNNKKMTSNSKKEYSIKNWDNSIPTKEYFNELKRVSKNQIIWGVNYFDGFGLNGGRIIWNKLGKDIGRRNPMPNLSDCEIAYCSMRTNIKMFSYTQIGNVYGNDYQIDFNQNRIHPTQKPVALYKWILDTYAVCKTCKNEHGYFEDVAGDGGSKMWQPCEDCYHEETGTNGFKILDTHLGSGSIAIACHDYGFELTACELDKEYYDKAIERIKKARELREKNTSNN
jgi:site-specific DNA-methyltransferase (adenine-specific)